MLMVFFFVPRVTGKIIKLPTLVHINQNFEKDYLIAHLSRPSSSTFRKTLILRY